MIKESTKEFNARIAGQNAFAKAIDIDSSSIEQVTIKKNGTIVAELRNVDINFEHLTAVSAFYGTTKINIDSEVREGGYCDTCNYSYAVTVLTIMGATKNT